MNTLILNAQNDREIETAAEIIKGIPRTGVFSRDRNGRYERVSL